MFTVRCKKFPTGRGGTVPAEHPPPPSNLDHRNQTALLIDGGGWRAMLVYAATTILELVFLLDGYFKELF